MSDTQRRDKRPIFYHCNNHGDWDATRESGCPRCVSEMRRELAAVKAERDALRVDADRLTWLDQQRQDIVDCDSYGDPVLIAHGWGIQEQAMDIRTAIDAARKEGE